MVHRPAGAREDGFDCASRFLPAVLGSIRSTGLPVFPFMTRLDLILSAAAGNGAVRAAVSLHGRHPASPPCLPINP